MEGRHPGSNLGRGQALVSRLKAKIEAKAKAKAEMEAAMSRLSVKEEEVRQESMEEKECVEKKECDVSQELTSSLSVSSSSNLPLESMGAASLPPLASSTPLPESEARSPVLSKEDIEWAFKFVEETGNRPQAIPPPVPRETGGGEDRGGVFLDEEDRMHLVLDTAMKPGSLGTEVDVEVNFLPLVKEDDLEGIFEYEVNFEPPVDSLNERHRCVKSHKKEMGGVTSFNGSSLDMPKRLDQDIWSRECQLTSGESTLMTLRFKRVKSFSDETSLSILNVLFRRIMNALGLVQIRRNFYDPRAKMDLVQYRLEVWPGFVTRVDEFDGGLHLQCDVSHRVLRLDNAHEVFEDLYRRRVADVKREAEKLIVGSIVLTRYNNRTYRVDDIDYSISPLSTFETSSSEDISYVDYYLKQYGIRIKDDKQPMLVSHIKGGARSSVDLRICLPPELCHLTGMTESMRGDFKLNLALAKLTKPSPEERKQQLNQFIANVNANEDAKALLANWGLRLGETPLTLKARQLPSTILKFGQRKTEKVGMNAEWTRAATSLPVKKNVDVNNWIIIFQDRDKRMAQDFAKAYQSLSNSIGINVGRPTPQSVRSTRTDDIIRALRDNVKEDTQLVVILLDQLRTDRYSAIKKVCYIERPVASQVILTRTLGNPKRFNSVVQKVALQINCKFGGELWGLENVDTRGFMVVGIDAFHDPAEEGPSALGFVSSLNEAMSRWHSESAMQNPKQELVDILKQCMSSALHAYYTDNNQWPTRVVVFRDGVGEGQLEAVMKHEVPQLKNVLEACDKPPELIFIVVQKRITAKIYARPTSGQLRNPRPGTVIDHTITRRKWNDFYLCPQNVNQGTVAPSHFIVLLSNSLSMDELQVLAFRLTHQYFNWCGAVRVPAPVMYAHKLAAMVGEHLRATPSPELSNQLFYL